MKERGIIMSAPMVRAILDGRKTQTRRVMKIQPGRFDHFEDDINDKGEIRFWWDVDKGDGKVIQEYSGPIRCPYGVVGDRLWVRETWARNPEIHATVPGACLYRADRGQLTEAVEVHGKVPATPTSEEII